MFRRTTLAALIAIAAAAPSLSAQSLRYASVTKMELGGAFGRMMSMMPGVGDPMESVTSIQGLRVRTDDPGNTSTIVDWETGMMTMLDHASRTYARMDFQQMIEQMGAGMQQAAAEQSPEVPEQPAAEFDFRFATERTGRTERVAGYEAEQVFLTMELVPKEAPDAEDEEDEAERAGMAVVTELWLSADFPEYAMMQAMDGETVERMRESAAKGAGASMAMFASYDPRLSEAMERNATELGKMEGHPVRMTTHFVAVPQDVPLDRDAVLASADRSLAGDAAGAAASGAADAAKKALGGLAGRFGRGRREEPEQEEEEEAPAQAVFMRVTTEVRDVDIGELDASIFEVPEGYTERTVEGPVGS